jgi:hypothetical protein
MVIFALALTGLLVFTGLAVDGGMLYFQRRNAQTAADSAAFAGGYAVTRGLGWNATALARAAANGFNNDVVTNWVTVTYPYTPPNTSGSNYIRVVIRARVKTNFIHLVFPGLVETTSEAVVKVTAASPVGGNNALVGTSPTDCDTVLVNGTTSVTVSGGNIFSNSTAGSQTCQSMEKKGSTNVLNVTGGNILVAGGYDSTGQSLHVSPMPTQGVPQMSTLYFPAPSCLASSNFSAHSNTSNHNVTVGSNTTIYDGVYSNITLHNGDHLTMNPGLYCITGDFTMTGGQLDGSGVTIVMLGGSIDLTGNGQAGSATATPTPLPTATPVHGHGGGGGGGGGTSNDVVTLSAPSTSPTNYVSTDGSTYNYVGMLIFADPTKYTGSSDQDNIKIGGSDGNSYTGTIYAPNTTCDLSGNSGTVTYNSQIYCYTVNLSGGADLSFVFNSNQNWPVPPQLELSH